MSKFIYTAIDGVVQAYEVIKQNKGHYKVKRLDNGKETTVVDGDAYHVRSEAVAEANKQCNAMESGAHDLMRRVSAARADLVQQEKAPCLNDNSQPTEKE